MREIIVATINGNTTTYDTWEDFYKATFNPNTDYEVLSLGKLTGKTYTEKKDEIRAKAIDFQYMDEGGLSWGEIAMICGYFETYGRRFGLLREFKENGIC